MKSRTLLLLAIGGTAAYLLYRQTQKQRTLAGLGADPVPPQQQFDALGNPILPEGVDGGEVDYELSQPEVDVDSIAQALKSGAAGMKDAMIKACIATAPLELGESALSIVMALEIASLTEAAATAAEVAEAAGMAAETAASASEAAASAAEASAAVAEGASMAACASMLLIGVAIIALHQLTKMAVGKYYERKFKRELAAATDNINNYALSKTNEAVAYIGQVLESESNAARAELALRAAMAAPAAAPMQGLGAFRVGAFVKRVTNPLQDAWTRVVTKPILKPLDKAIIKPVMKPVMRVTNAVVTPIVRQATTNLIAETGHAIASGSHAIGFKEGEKAGRYTEKVGDKGNEWVEKKGDWVERMGTEGIVGLSQRTGARISKIYTEGVKAGRMGWAFFVGKGTYDLMHAELMKMIRNAIAAIDANAAKMKAWADDPKVRAAMRRATVKSEAQVAADMAATSAAMNEQTRQVSEAARESGASSASKGGKTTALVIGGGLAATAAVFALGSN